MADNKGKVRDFGKYSTPIDLGYFDYSTQDPGARGPGGVYPHRGSVYPPEQVEVKPTPDAMRGDPRFAAPQPQSRGWFYDNFIKDNENIQMFKDLSGDVKQGFKKLDEGLKKVNDWAADPENYENRGTVRKLPGLRESVENFKTGWNEYFGKPENNEAQRPAGKMDVTPTRDPYGGQTTLEWAVDQLPIGRNEPELNGPGNRYVGNSKQEPGPGYYDMESPTANNHASLPPASQRSETPNAMAGDPRFAAPSQE